MVLKIFMLSAHGTSILNVAINLAVLACFVSVSRIIESQN
jgi:hypothetical protein